MPRSNGTYTPPAGSTANGGKPISSAAHNALVADLSTALTQSIATDGTSVITQNIPMAGNKFIGLGPPTAQTDSVRLGDIIPKYSSGASLPSSDIGPIWHADYNDIMIWQVFNANGAGYSGYASRDIGIGRTEIIPTPRAGWIKRNGASLSRSTYAALRGWAMHNGLFVPYTSWAAGTSNFCDNADGTTFKIPDVRGEFPRYWDDGRGVDSGRGLATWQDSDNKSHAHGVNDPGHGHRLQNPSDTSKKFNFAGTTPGSFGDQLGLGGQNGVAYGNPIEAAPTGITIQSSGGSEARGRNTSELAVIKF